MVKWYSSNIVKRYSDNVVARYRFNIVKCYCFNAVKRYRFNVVKCFSRTWENRVTLTTTTSAIPYIYKRMKELHLELHLELRRHGAGSYILRNHAATAATL